VPYEERRRMVLAFADAIKIRNNSFSDLLVQEQGKPRDQALTETSQAIEWIRGMARFPLGDETIEDSQRCVVKTRYLPLGVVVAIDLSWDFPMLNCTAKIAAALLTGNVIIVKPCVFAPSCGLKLVELAQCFFPCGVVQSLSGDTGLGGMIADQLQSCSTCTGLRGVIADQPSIDKIGLSRSPQAEKGKLILGNRHFLQDEIHRKRREKLILRGNDPAIPMLILREQPRGWHTMHFSTPNSHNIKRIYVHESIFEEFKAALVKVIKGFKLGDGSKAENTHGPMQNKMYYQRVKDILLHFGSMEYDVAVGGKIDRYSPLASDYFVPFTVVERPHKNAHIVVHEKLGNNMPKAVAPPRRGRFTPFARTPRTPAIAIEDTMLPSFDNFPAYLIESRAAVAHLFINNKTLMSKSKDWTSILDPVTQALLCRVPCSTHQEVQSAVNSANAAQEDWEGIGFQARREYLLKLIDVLREMSPLIIASLCREVGKTIEDAESEVHRGLDCIHAACSIGPEMAGMFLGNDPTMLQTFYEPVGVCATITPFSFPFMTPLWSIPYALITGNTVVLKPSERAVSVPALISEAVIKADFPPGVFNIVHGGYSVSQMLILQPLVRAISFVGSESAARQVHDLARKAGKRIQAECGGKNHGVILEDAEMMPTLFAIAGSAFGAAGQRCMSLSVAIFVGNTARWIPKLVDVAKSMTVGNGSDEDTKIGPLIDKDAKSKITGIIERSIEEGAVLLCDGRDVSVPNYPNGNFLGPTILSGVETYMECYQTEIFGPVLICMQVDTLEEAIELINQNKYGNGCSIFTTSGKHAKTFQRQVNVGQIGINIPLIAPYGTATDIVPAKHIGRFSLLPRQSQRDGINEFIFDEI
ncbi:methylmalonate-semialdehyde dehydrogenase, partial [Penicillium herquei]